MLLRKISLFTLSFLFATSLTLGLTSLAAQELLYPEPYTQALADSGAYDEMNEQLGLPPAVDAQPVADALINQTLQYVRGETDNYTVIAVIPGTTHEDLIAQIESLPPCSETQSEMCRPEGVPPEMLASILEERIDTTQPQEIDLTPPIPQEQLDTAQGAVSTFRIVAKAALLASLVFALLIFFVARSLKQATHWIDAELVFTGSSLAASGYFLRDYVHEFLPPGAQALQGPLTSVLSVMLDAMLYYGLIVLAVGVVLFVAALFLKEKK